MNETTNSTGTQFYNKPTLLGHIIAHIENARKVFDIKPGWYGGPHGLEYDKRFPRYVGDVARKIDEKYSTNQSREYSYRNTPIKTHDPIYNNGDDNCGDWPSRNYDGDLDTSEGNQIRIWMSNLDYMLRDAAITYTAILRDEEDKDAREVLTLLVIELWDHHAKYEEDQQGYYREQVEVKPWIIDSLWERGEVTTSYITADGKRIRADLTWNNNGETVCTHGYGDTLPKAIGNLWNKVYELEKK